MDNQTRIRFLCDEYSYLDNLKATLASEFQEIVDYVLPDRSNITRWETPGARRGRVRYDDTAVDSVEILAGNLAATIVPMGAQWMSIVAQQTELRRRKRIADWSQEVSELMIGAMATSNFYQAMDECFLDLVGFGTAAPYGELKRGKLNYITWPIRDYVFSCDTDGRPSRIYRKWKMTPKQMDERFRKHPGFKQLGQTAQAALDAWETVDAGTRNREIEVLHVIGPREHYQPGKAGARNMPIESCYVNVTDMVIIAEGGYEEMPVNIVRWRMTSDDAGWGRGCGQKAMSNILSLNVCRKLMHKAGAKDLDPPLLIDDRGVIGNVRTMSNGITYLRPGARMEYLTSGQRIDLAQFGLERITNEVKQAFYADHLRLPPPQGTPMTATEMQMRWELMERLLGPTLGRIVTELMNPIVERTFGLLMRDGQLPEPPQELIDAELDIEYLGPLARAQQMPEVASIERTWQFATNLAQLTGDRAALRRLDADESVKRVAQLYGFPADALRDDDEVAAMAEQEQQEAQGMQDRQDAMMAADMASKVPQQQGRAA